MLLLPLVAVAAVSLLLALDYIDEASAQTPKPVILDAWTGSGGFIRVYWEAVPNADSYRFEARRSPTHSWLSEYLQPVVPTSVTDWSLPLTVTNNPTPQVRVGAEIGGTVYWSDILTLVRPAVPDPTPTPYNGHVLLVWDKAAPPTRDFEVQYKPSTGNTWTTYPDRVSPVRSVSVDGLTNGVTYDFRVRAHGHYISAWSDVVSTTPCGGCIGPTIATDPPYKPIPSVLQVLRFITPPVISGTTDTTISLEWDKTAGGIVKFRVEYKPNTTQSWNHVDVSESAPYVTLTGLQNNTQYDIRVGVLARGLWTWSDVQSQAVQPMSNNQQTVTWLWSDILYVKTKPSQAQAPPPDTVRPVIVINGANPQTIVQNQPYAELGARCTDNSDSSPDITIHSSAVDTRTAGTYTVTYTCTDEAGNTSKDTRTVRVVTAPRSTEPETPSEPEPDPQLNSTTTPDPVPEQPQPEQPQPSPTPDPTPSITLNMSAFYDVNNDGKRNANETAAADIVVYISNTTDILDTGSNNTILYTIVTDSNGTASIEFPSEPFYAIVLPDQGLVPTTHLYHHNNTAHTGILHEPAPVPGQTYEMNVGIRDTIDRTKKAGPIILY